jgi:hypothetical protein
VDKVEDILKLLHSAPDADYEFDWPGTEEEARKYVRTYILTDKEPFGMISRPLEKGVHCKLRLLK